VGRPSLTTYQHALSHLPEDSSFPEVYAKKHQEK